MRRILIVGSLLVATVLIASVVATRPSGARVAATDASSGPDVEKPSAALPKTLGAKDTKDTKPPGTVQNLRRIDTVDEKEALASCEPKSPTVDEKEVLASSEPASR